MAATKKKIGRPAGRTFVTNFRMVLTPELHEQLESIARDQERSMAAAVRTLIRDEYRRLQRRGE